MTDKTLKGQGRLAGHNGINQNVSTSRTPLLLSTSASCKGEYKSLVLRCACLALKIRRLCQAGRNSVWPSLALLP